MSSEAKADGDARERVALGENIGTSMTGEIENCSGSDSAFVRADLLFMASFDCFGSDCFEDPKVRPRLDGEGYCIDGGSLD